ncbi:hypothetical protein [Actinotalea soli]|nr:hypothetical protein [Actinotalea soli]
MSVSILTAVLAGIAGLDSPSSSTEGRTVTHGSGSVTDPQRSR